MSRTPGELTGSDAQSRKAAFFDVDNTIIRGASAYHLGRRLYRRGFFRTTDLVRFAIDLGRYLVFGENRRQIASIRDRALSLVAGKSVADVTAVGEEVYDQVLMHRIFPGTLALVDKHLAAGDQVWLISATPHEIGELIATKLGATGALGTVAERKDGFYTGRLVGSLMHGETKAEAVRALAAREHIDLAKSHAYGDSANDIALLSTVGHPCGINPEPRLRKHCKTVGWPVRDFRHGHKAARRSINAATTAGAAWMVFITIRTATRMLRARKSRVVRRAKSGRLFRRK